MMTDDQKKQAAAFRRWRARRMNDPNLINHHIIPVDRYINGSDQTRKYADVRYNRSRWFFRELTHRAQEIVGYYRDPD